MSLSGYWAEKAQEEADRIASIKVKDDLIWRLPYQFYGNNRKFWDCLDSTVVLAGPSECGKSLSSLALLHWIALTNPGLRAVIVRRVRESMYSTILQSYQDKILPEGWTSILNGEEIKVTPYGGSRPSWYDYSNGSRIYVAGMDDAGDSSTGTSSNKILGAELDVIYVNQAEELELNHIEKLETRVTGRAGNIKNRPPQLLMDANPGGANHPIKIKQALGHLTMIDARHQDNPLLYDQATGEITEQGKRTMERLNRLTGVRKQRLLYGLWVGADGMYFEHFDPDVHGIDQFTLNDDMEVWASMDYGFNHWNVIYFHAKNGDGIITTFHELAHRKMYPHQIAPIVHDVLAEYGKTVADLSCFLAGADAFAVTGHSEETIAQKYFNHDISLAPAASGPQTRMHKAHLFQRLLGNPEVEDAPPQWFYVKDKCPKLAACIPLLVPDPHNAEVFKKVDSDQSGSGGDDPIDACLAGLYRPNVSSIA